MGILLGTLPLWFLLLLIIALGSIWGSFVGALCTRWPNDQSVVKGRSRCDHCATPIAAYDLVPIFSFLVLRGKCRTCGEPIGPTPFVIEMIAALIAVVPFLLFPGEQALGAAIFGWLLLPLVILDFQHLWLPTRLVLLLAVGGLVAGPLLSPDILWQDRMIGAALGFLCLEIIRRAFRWLRGHEGMGAGDPKMFAAIALWLGWAASPIVLLVASGIGIASMLAIGAARRAHETQFPFGSYMGVAAYCVALTA